MRRFLVSACLLAAAARVGALYPMVETKLVPVARLVANLEKEVAANPKDTSVRINLARLHGMAFALKADELPTGGFRGEKTEKPWYGYEPKLIPYEARPARTAESARIAEEHLTRALEHYRLALQMEPQNLLARLGNAWMLEQAGKKEEAIAEYRKVIAQAWPKEEEPRSVGPGQRFYTEEAAEYLIPLLDPVKNAGEIALLRERRQSLRGRPRAITPLVVPLVEGLSPDRIADRARHVSFDADGSGLPQRWTWISPQVGWLVYDRRGTGEITSALQWFGSVTFWLFWTNGYEALAALDDNRDGELSGGELQHLAIWHDENQNGRSDARDVRPLHTYDVAALSCRYVEGDGVLFAAISDRGIRFTNGTTRPTYDVILERVPVKVLTLR